MSNFDSFVEKARFLAGSASKKTGEFLEASQLKLKISHIKASIERKYAELGSIYYSKQKYKDTENTSMLDDKIQTVCKEIDALFVKLHTTEKECADIKKGVDICSCCGEKNQDKWSYCSNCGAKKSKVNPDFESTYDEQDKVKD